MATISKSNKDNFLTWEKVNGTLTLADLQSNGLPPRKSERVDDYNNDFSNDFTI